MLSAHFPTSPRRCPCSQCLGWDRGKHLVFVNNYRNTNLIRRHLWDSTTTALTRDLATNSGTLVSHCSYRFIESHDDQNSRPRRMQLRLDPSGASDALIEHFPCAGYISRFLPSASWILFSPPFLIAHSIPPVCLVARTSCTRPRSLDPKRHVPIASAEYVLSTFPI